MLNNVIVFGNKKTKGPIQDNPSSVHETYVKRSKMAVLEALWNENIDKRDFICLTR
jgi:hypothetical protein